MAKQGRLVLVVDHDPPTRHVIVEMLRTSGFDVIEASDGLAALDALRIRTPDLISLALRLPPTDGFDLLTRIRGRRHLRRVPVVALTAQTVTEDQVLDAGFDALIRKPMHPDDFVGQIARLVTRRRSAA